MTTPSKTAKPPRAKVVATFPAPSGKAKAEALANAALRPSMNAALVMDDYSKAFGEQDLGALATALSGNIQTLWEGDTKRTEAMLFAQAHALQAIFTNLARRATTQDYLKNWEAYLRMALKAQNQCRMTLETLATLKNPPVVFAKQANINHGGQQQVNNGPGVGQECAAPSMAPATSHDASATPILAGSSAVRTHPHAGKRNKPQNELLEAPHGHRLATRAAGKTSRADPHMATVATRHGPAHR